MKHNSPKSVTDVLNNFLRQEGLEPALLEYRIISSWPHVIGEKLGKYTRNVSINNQILHVEVTSPIVRNEIMMKRQDLVQQLNAIAGARIIVDIFVN